MMIAGNTADLSLARPAPAPEHAAPRGAVYLATTLLVAVVLILQSNVRDSATSDVKLDAQVLLRLGLIAACGLYGFVHLPRTLPSLVRFPMGLLTLFVVWNFICAIFAVRMNYSMTSTAALMCCVMFVAAVVHTLGGRRTVITIAASHLVWLVLTWAFFLFVPSVGRDPFNEDADLGTRLAGLMHPNGTGTFAALAVILLIVIGLQRWVSWKWLVFPMAFAGFSLWATDSRTAILTVGAAVAVLSWRLVKPAFWALGAIAGLAALMVWSASGPTQSAVGLEDFSRTGESEEVSSLNGRTELWSFVIREIFRSPLVGYGHGCQRFVIEEFRLNWDATHAHNVFLQVSLGGGWFCGLLLAAMFLWLFVDCLRRPDPVPDALAVAIFVGALAHAGLLGLLPDSTSVLFMVALMWRTSTDIAPGASEPLKEEQARSAATVSRTMRRAPEPSLLTTAERIGAHRGDL